MEAILQALGGILLKSVPTLLLLLIVHLYLKFMFFGPLRDVLQKRREATEGARQAGELALSKAGERAGEIDAALRKAREEIYAEQEQMRKQLMGEQTEAIEAARQKSHDLVHQAREALNQETEAVKRELAATAQALADGIAQRLLEGRAA